MTTDIVKPAVITAAEFAKEYVEHVASGKCVVMDEAKCYVMRVSTDECTDDTVLLSYTDGAQTYWWEYDADEQFTVHWLPVAASSTDADEVARLRAEVARLREVMTRILRDDELNADRYKSWIIAALDATEEAQS